MSVLTYLLCRFLCFLFAQLLAALKGVSCAYLSGPTRLETKISEAQSYANLAVCNQHWNLLPDSIPPTTISTPTPTAAAAAAKNPRAENEFKILIEDRALDSYHNVLFSLTLFYSKFGTWPARMTLVSHDFKRQRLVDGHCTAIGFPLNRVSFVGIDPPGMANAGAGDGEKKDAIRGVAQAEDDWLADPHGRDRKLARKRAIRNPWAVDQSVFGDRGVGETGGLVMRGDGWEETLVDDAPRPWA